MSKKEDFVKFDKVDKSYDGKILVVKDLNLDIEEGEFVTMLGPSGSGKTTCLMMLAGFETPTNGEIYLDKNPISNIPPHKRGIGMVFQNYALFPHMTVFENLAFPLRVRKISKEDIEKKVDKALAMVSLSEFGNRMPGQLSGGQQQRVQLARALILENDVLLLDEPLSALDAQLRKDMCIELKRLQKTVGISFVHVTHNQEEAMSVADRIAIIADGEMVEQGSPKEIYSNPKKKFTAEFIGEKNILNGVVVDFNKSKILVNIEKDEIEVANNNYTIAKNQEISLSIKSESIQISKVSSSKSKGAKNSITGKVTEITFLGQFVRYLVLLSNIQEIQVRSNNEVEGVSLNDQINLTWSLDDFLIHES